ncbi:transcriptional attenuator, LytR family [Streptomyces sp. KS_16]|nr:LytR family transcriptional attenuator [Streptomyces sp. 2321.6]SDR37064.1 transcriptional attenuator, LytR family [Streptomyces sp. KS_16]SED13770.1 transcriptional attenuator, LytR family [Streptomyces sp. 2133.1]SNC70004.1 cell envelope-related function transcriptional attenuator common domain-containing protein [Streptomyces sp. 2114.4]
MNDWLDRPPETWRGGETETTYPGPGQVWPPEEQPPQMYPPQMQPPQMYPPQGPLPQTHPPQGSLPQTHPTQELPPQTHPSPGPPPQMHWPQMDPARPMNSPLPGVRAPVPAPTPPVRSDAPGGNDGRAVRPGRVGPGAGRSGPEGGRAGRGRRAARRSPRRRRIRRTAILLVTVLLSGSLGSYVWADTQLNREVDLSKIADRMPEGKGTNYLIVGSDSRVGLSDRAKKDLHTGGSADAGRRTDSMILLHTGAHGTTMVSLPRDSWVTIPPYIRPDTGKHYRAAKNKLNAAFSFGGPDLLVQTIERNTGVHIDHYTEIGFAGFVGIVDAIGGVPICLDRAVRDKKSGANLKKGCQTLDGRTALAFVRQRHQEAQGDLGRSQNQQKFLAALARKAAEPDILLDPAKVYPTMSAGLGTLIVDEDTGLTNLTSLFKAMKGVTAGDGKRLNVPVSNLNLRTPKGSAVQWNEAKAKELFTELNDDRPVTVGEKG